MPILNKNRYKKINNQIVHGIINKKINNIPKNLQPTIGEIIIKMPEEVEKIIKMIRG
jgi:hypothetical protein